MTLIAIDPEKQQVNPDLPLIATLTPIEYSDEQKKQQHRQYLCGSLIHDLRAFAASGRVRSLDDFKANLDRHLGELADVAVLELIEHGAVKHPKQLVPVAYKHTDRIAEMTKSDVVIKNEDLSVEPQVQLKSDTE